MRKPLTWPRSCALALCAFLTAAQSPAATMSRASAAPRGAVAAVPGLRAGVGVSQGPSLSGGTLQAPGLAPAFSLSAAPVVGAGPIAAPLAPAPDLPSAQVLAAVEPAAPGLSVSAQPQVLSPERREQYQSLSSELTDSPAGAPAEESKDLGARFFEAPARVPAATAENVGAGGIGSSAGAGRTDFLTAGAEPSRDAVSVSLAPTSGAQTTTRAPASAPRRRAFEPETGLLATLKDRAYHAHLLARHYYWYTITHIQDLWPAYQEKRGKLTAQGEVPAVTRPRTFFSHMRVMGETGVFYVLGFAALNDQAVLQESRRTFDRCFDGPGIGPAQRAAFERFLGRIEVFNKAHRAHSNMKKHIRDALLAASVMPGRAIAPFFDSLAVKDKSDEIEAFQREGAAEMIETYRQTVMQTLAEEPDTQDRILGVVLMGSFARGAATPTSDMDTEPLARDGQDGRVQLFNDRLVARWEALGLQKNNPITPHEHALHPSKGLLSLVHVSGDFLVFSDDQALVDAVSNKTGEASPARLVRDMTVRGRIGRILEFLTVYAVTAWTDVKRALSR